METELDTSSARIFYDGLLTEPRLDHPEGPVVHRDGSVWCGGERGQIYRIEPDGSSMGQAASSGGFSQGMAFDAEITFTYATSSTRRLCGSTQGAALSRSSPTASTDAA